VDVLLVGELVERLEVLRVLKLVGGELGVEGEGVWVRDD